MHWQATRNWDRLIGWGLLFLWVGNPLASAQTSEDILRLISQDEEDTVHEDELIILDDILSKSTGLTHQLLEEILALTFLANEYYDLIRNSLDSPDFTSLKTSQKISPALMFIFVTLQRNMGVPHKIHIQQIVSMTDGVRYRWKGRMDTMTQEMGALSVRNRYGVDILDQHNLYIQQRTGNRRWIAGDHQMAFGFGLISGKPFPARKGWSTVNTGTSVQNGLKGYKSSTGMNRTRGFAIEQKTHVGTFTVSHGQGGEGKNNNRNFTRGAWKYENSSILIGTVFAPRAQSISDLIILKIFVPVENYHLGLVPYP